MLKEYLQKADEALLWRILYDISAIMSDSMRHLNSREEIAAADAFWISAAGEVKDEIDRRLFDGYEGTAASDDLEDFE